MLDVKRRRLPTRTKCPAATQGGPITNPQNDEPVHVPVWVDDRSSVLQAPGWAAKALGSYQTSSGINYPFGDCLARAFGNPDANDGSITLHTSHNLPASKKWPHPPILRRDVLPAPWNIQILRLALGDDDGFFLCHTGCAQHLAHRWRLLAPLSEAAWLGVSFACAIIYAHML